MSEPVVFYVISYKQTPLIERVLGKLADTDSAITLVHHDPTGSEPPRLPDTGRAHFVPDAQHLPWGKMAINHAVHRGMRWAVERLPGFSWFVIMSAQDYPVMSPRAIEAELLGSQADVYMRWEFIPPFVRRYSTDWQRSMSHRYYWRVAAGTTRPVPWPRLHAYFDGIGVFAGSNWCTLGRRAVERILSETQLHARLERRFRSTMAPSEAFYQTLLMNSPIGLHIVNDDRRYYRFPTTGDPGHPFVLTLDDLDTLLARNPFFARKVDLERSAELMDRLDELHAASSPPPRPPT